MSRNANNGIRKVCRCPRRTWAKCPHPWHFNFKLPRGESFRFSVDTEAGEHIASKGEAEALADGWRSQIRLGTFRRRAEQQPAVTAAPALPTAVTLHLFIEKYVERCEPPVSTNDRGCLRTFAAFAIDGRTFGDHEFRALTEDTIEVFFASLRKAGRAASTRNKFVQAIKAAFRWGTKKGYLDRNPTADAEHLKREQHAKRDRRLMPDLLNDEGKMVREGEERRLLAVSEPLLQRRIIGAIETCCRRGELLALQWRDVNLSTRELLVRAEEEGARKTGVGRRLPISTRLAAVLEMAQTAMETMLRSGPAKGLSDREVAAALGACYVFGDEAGLKVDSFKRSWQTAVLKAHGHTPQWTKTTKALTRDSRAALEAIDLHFHDLRHEGGSRLLESGWPLHHVQHMLGHTNLAQTSTYLNATRIGLHESMRRFEAIPPGCNPVANNSTTDPSLKLQRDSIDSAQPVVN